VVAAAPAAPRQQRLGQALAQRLVEVVALQRPAGQPLACRGRHLVEGVAHAHAGGGQLARRARADERPEVLVAGDEGAGEDARVLARDDVGGAAHRVDRDDPVGVEPSARPRVQRHRRPTRREVLQPARRDRGERVGTAVQVVAGDAVAQRLLAVEPEHR
jgi:hypothetical protein